MAHMIWKSGGKGVPMSVRRSVPKGVGKCVSISVRKGVGRGVRQGGGKSGGSGGGKSGAHQAKNTSILTSESTSEKSNSREHTIHYHIYISLSAEIMEQSGSDNDAREYIHTANTMQWHEATAGTQTEQANGATEVREQAATWLTEEAMPRLSRQAKDI